MAYLLHLETSATICSVALSKDSLLMDVLEDVNENSHASKLTKLIDQLLVQTNIDYKELSAISFSCGPGSYTGLRIGLSAAKGLCYALGIPLVFIPTLEALIDEMISINPDPEAIYCPMIDARRMEVYMMQMDIKKNCILPQQAFIISDQSLAEISHHKKLIVAGSGFKKAQSLLISNNITCLELNYSSSRYVVKRAYEKFIQNEFEDIAYCEPTYIKSPLIK